MNYDYKQLEKLMLQKDFEELSLAEKMLIQDWITPEAYQQERLILLESKRILSQQTPLQGNPLSDLQTHFKTTYPPKTSWRNYSLPMYQAILFASIVGIIVWYWRPVSIQTQIQKEIVYRTQIDTIFKEKILVEEKIVYKTKFIKTSQIQVDTIYIPAIDKDQLYQEKETNTIFAKEPIKGKSMKDMGELMDFVIGTDS